MGDQAEILRDIAAKKSEYKNNLTHKSRIITITSGKGGVGKSNITASLALALANIGKKVVILDADFGMANVDIIFGLIQQHIDLFLMIECFSPIGDLVAGHYLCAKFCDDLSVYPDGSLPDQHIGLAPGTYARIGYILVQSYLWFCILGFPQVP